jgi:hypothetical protein
VFVGLALQAAEIGTDGDLRAGIEGVRCQVWKVSGAILAIHLNDNVGRRKPDLRALVATATTSSSTEALGLVGRVEAALQGQAALDGPDPLVEGIVARIRSAAASSSPRVEEMVSVYTDQVSLEMAREAGPVHVGHHLWLRLGMPEMLRELGFPERARWSAR